ncbi:transposase [Skermanella aerolata]
MGYPTDLSDEQWALVAPLIPPARPGGRCRTAVIFTRFSGHHC